MSWNLIPKEEKFFGLFEAQANYICEGIRVLKKLLSEWSLESPHFAKLRDLEHEADITTHEIMDKLNRTFITPFDREDIHKLASELDDVMDLIHGVAARMHLFRIDKTTDELNQFVDILQQSAEAVKKAVLGLHDMKKTRRVLDYCIEINRLENMGDQVQEMALGKLFTNRYDPLEVMKWKEIYEIAEAAIDKCEDVANAIESVVVKNG